MIWFYVAYALCGIPFIKPLYKGLLKVVTLNAEDTEKPDEVIAICMALTFMIIWPIVLVIGLVHRWVKSDESV